MYLWRSSPSLHRILIGLVNGLTITKLKVNPFIATLGTSLIIKGIINATFSNYTGSVPKSFEYFGYGTVGPVPVSIIILLLIVLAAGFCFPAPNSARTCME